MSDIDERLEEEILHAFRKSFDSQKAGINANFLMDIQREIERLRADLAAANTRMSKLDFERTAAELERDAIRADLAARLAPVDDEALVEIVADAISTYVPDQVSKWGSIKDAAIDAIAAIRPHIEEAERERCAKIAEGYIGNDALYCPTDAGREGYATACRSIAAAIRSGK